MRSEMGLKMRRSLTPTIHEETCYVTYVLSPKNMNLYSFKLILKQSSDVVENSLRYPCSRNHPQIIYSYLLGLLGFRFELECYRAKNV